MDNATSSAPANDGNGVDTTPAEFVSAILTFDHLLNRDDGHVVQKMVFSTQSDVESLLALFAYYGEPYMTQLPKTLEVLREGAKANNPVYVYVTPRGEVQSVMSIETMDFLASHPDFGKGTTLGLTDALTRTIASMHNELIARAAKATAPDQRGRMAPARITPLILIAADLGDPDRQGWEDANRAGSNANPEVDAMPQGQGGGADAGQAVS